MLTFTESNNVMSRTPLLEEGTYPAVCYMLADVGDHLNEFQGQGKWQRQIVIGWELPTETVEIDGEKKPRVFSCTYTASLHEKSKLRKDLVSWRGRQFTDEELKGFDMTSILNAPCLLNIVHTVSKKSGKTRATLSGIMRLPKGMPKPERTLDFVVYDMDGIDPIPASMPRWIAEMARESRTFAEKHPEELAAANAAKESYEADDRFEAAQPEVNSGVATFVPVDDDESGLPF